METCPGKLRIQLCRRCAWSGWNRCGNLRVCESHRSCVQQPGGFRGAAIGNALYPASVLCAGISFSRLTRQYVLCRYRACQICSDYESGETGLLLLPGTVYCSCFPGNQRCRSHAGDCRFAECDCHCSSWTQSA